jgi:heme exporter protein A
MNVDAHSTALRIEKVEKWFGQNSALEDITLNVRTGDFLVLLGRNGAGKSTLLRVMARIVKPNHGRVEICGVDVRSHPDAVRRSLGFVAHSSYLYRHLTARENLRFFARLYSLENREQRIQAALDWVGLESSSDRPISGFSRGMQQRLAIARATLHDPEILLLDEPFSGLDLEAAELLSGWMKRFAAAGKTILMATHDLEHGLEGVNRWVFLDKGRIVEELTGAYTVVRDRYKQFLRERKGELS